MAVMWSLYKSKHINKIKRIQKWSQSGRKKLGLSSAEKRRDMIAVFKVVKGVERIHERSVCMEWGSNKGT